MARKPAKKTAKKKPRRKKTSGSGRPVKNYGESKKAKLSLPSKRSKAGSLFEARLRYVTDPQRRTVTWWWTTHYSDVVSEKHFSTVATKQQWVAQRDQHWEHVAAAVARDQALEHAERRKRELQTLEDAFDVSTSFVVGKDSQGNVVPITIPKDFGQAASAMAKIHSAMEQTRERISADLPLAMGAAPDEDEGLVEFSQEELLAMAQARLRVQHQLPANVDDEDVEEDG